ncbi:MAG: hypothetical protein ACRC7B_00985 [Metamycoplasmataceae bacterium]
MISNFKKLTLGIMSASAIIVPVVVTACGTTESLEIIDFQINKIANPQLVWGNINGDNYKKLLTLNKVFEGLNNNNLKNLEIAINPVDAPNNYQITLSAKNGYSINEEKILGSNVFNIKDDMDISIITIVPTDIKASDIEGDKYKNFQVLSKLFNGIDFIEINFPNLIFELKPTANINSFQIEASPIDGITINGSSESLTSVEFTLDVVYNLKDIKIND